MGPPGQACGPGPGPGPGDPGPRDHGTHVVGSVAGLSEEGPQEAPGSAYEAKLTFFDIGVNGGLTVPRNLQTTIFKHGYDTGARVHTNSWGANTADYTSNARDVDAFMYDNDDFLILVAAGNSGQNGVRSVGTPATCKRRLRHAPCAAKCLHCRRRIPRRNR